VKAIEVALLGVRNCKPPTIIPVPAGVDAYVFMALYLDEKMTDDYLIVRSYGNADTFGLCKRGSVAEPAVLRVRLIDIAEVVEASKAS
jgi:hypothetical protein